MELKPRHTYFTSLIVLTLLLLARPTQAVSTTLVINEIDYDQPSTDTAEFLELKNVSGGSINLSTFTVEMVNGASGGALIYRTFVLPSVDLAAGDYYVICANAATVPNCDLDVTPDTDLIQNGSPDALGLRQSGTLVDAVSYEGNSGALYVEGSGVGLEDISSVVNGGISRFPDGIDTDVNNADFSLRCITPGSANVSASSSCGAPPVSVFIHDIQGAAHQSPLLNQNVAAQGVVTAVTSNGFYLQDPNPDGSNATSEGIFVFTSSTPGVSVGDTLNVTGTVAEFYPGGISTNNLPTTELTGPAITLISSGSPLPAPVIIGNGGRLPPAAVIEDDVNGTVETSGTFDADTDGLDFYESLEGMRVQVNDAIAVSATSPFGEIAVVGDNGANAGPLSARGSIVVQPGDFNPERVILDDGILPTPIVNVGDHFTSPIVGVLDYSFGNFKLLITQPASTLSAGLSGEVGPIATPGQLSVATFNVENLDPGDGPAKFGGLASDIVNRLHSPDIVGLEEVQDNNGAVDNGVVDASDTLNTLIAAIQAAGGPTYEFRQINPIDDQDGGEPGGNIRVAFLFRPDRVTFVDRPGGGSTSDTGVVLGTDGVELTFSPGRIDPTDSAFNTSRKPLAGEFVFNGETVIVILNHFNSKGGDTPLFGRLQPPVLNSEAQRLQQAQIVNDFVDSILALDSDTNVIVFGDLNDFPFSPPLATVAGDVLTNLMTTLPANEQYTFIFDGNAQVLDNFLVTDHLFGQFGQFDIVHINAEFTDAIRHSDHDPSIGLFTVVRTVTLDIKPGDAPNDINLRARGVVPVAILSSADFDATTVNPATVTFAGAPVGGNGGSFADVNGDGLLDLVLHFEISALELNPGDTEAPLEGQTFDGFSITGTDTVNIVGPGMPGGLTANYPVFIWDAVENATCYQIQLDNQPNFNSPEQDATVVDGTQYNASALTPGRYHWRVRVGGNCVDAATGDWSEGDSFMVQ